MKKAVLFILMLVTGFFGIKSCKKPFNEGYGLVTVQATVIDKFIGTINTGTFGGSESCGYLVLKPHVPKPKIYTKSVMFDEYYRLNKGDKTTLYIREYIINEDCDDGFAFTLFGFILCCLSLYFLLGVIVVDND